MQISTLDNTWKRAAIGSFIGYGLTAMLAFISLNTAGRPTDLILEFFVSALAISATLHMFGVFFVVYRVKYFYLILGALGFFPMLVFFVTPAVLTTMLVDGMYAWKAFYWAAFFSSAIFLSYRSIRKTKALEIQYKYLASEIKLEGSQAYVDRQNMKDLWELAPRREFGPRLNKFLGTALCFLPSLFPLQIILFRMDENLHVVVHMSILCIPLSMYLIVKICSGYYLWIHLVERFESRIGLPVLFRGFL
jgi:hypothetical protein